MQGRRQQTLQMTMASPINKAQRIRGSLYGVAVTDALGGPIEFKQRGSFPPVTKFLFNPHFDLPPGSFTDDTSMTLCLAQSLVDTKGKFILQDQIRKYVKWKEEGYMSSSGHCFDIGNATRRSLGIWKKYFDQRPDMDVFDPQGHAKGQEAIDKALKHEVSSILPVLVSHADASESVGLLQLFIARLSLHFAITPFLNFSPWPLSLSVVGKAVVSPK